MAKIIEFDSIGNYRGGFQIKEDNGYFCRVDCDIENCEWAEIPKSLFDELYKYSTGVDTREFDT